MVSSSKSNLVTLTAPSWKEQGYIPARYVICGLTFLGLMFNYMLRVNINFSIVAMVKNKDPVNNSVDIQMKNGTITNEDTCDFGQLDQIKKEYEGDFEWDEWTQAQITGSFYWGYVWSQIPGGRLGEVVGAKHVFSISLALAAIFNLIIPVAAKNSYIALIAVRVLLGLAEGTTYPAVQGLFSCWAPPQERSLLLTIAHIGAKFGIMITYPIAAVLIKTWGWESTFYAPAIACLVWCVIWSIVVTNDPNDYRWITEVEKNYIAQSVGDTVATKDKANTPPLPLRSIITSLPFWAIVIGGMGGSVGFFTLLTYLPLYMKTMLQYDMKSNAAFSGLPYLGFIILSLLIGFAGDKLRQKGHIKTTTLRKISETIAHCGPALCMVCVTFLPCDRTSTLILFFIAVTCQGGEISGWIVNSLDLAPNFAGTLMGIANAAATTGGWLAPLMVGTLINNQQTFEQWRKVFYIVAGIYCADSLFYIIFGSGEIQKWNYSKGTEEDENPKSQTENNCDQEMQRVNGQIQTVN